MQTSPLALAIIEDQASIREALREYLDAQPKFTCVLVARSMEDFLNRLPGVATPPTLVLSGIGLPGRSGIEGMPLLLERLPAAPSAPAGRCRRSSSAAASKPSRPAHARTPAGPPRCPDHRRPPCHPADE